MTNNIHNSIKTGQNRYNLGDFHLKLGENNVDSVQKEEIPCKKIIGPTQDGAGDEEMLCKCFDKCCKAFIQ